MKPLTQGEMQHLSEEFIVEYTYNSNAIEDSTLTLRETDTILKGLTIDQKPLKEHMEAVGHKEAFEFVSGLVKDNIPLTESIIKQIHYLVLADKKEDRGIYRKVPVKILGAKHEPVQPYLIQPKMEALLKNYNESTEEIISKLDSQKTDRIKVISSKNTLAMDNDIIVKLANRSPELSQKLTKDIDRIVLN